MKYLSTTAIAFLLSMGTSQATIQHRDIVIYKRDTMYSRTFPLEQLYGMNKLPFCVGGAISSACWRGSTALWEVTNNQLYLVSVSCCDKENTSGEVNLEDFFAGRVFNGRVKADWYTDTLIMETSGNNYYEMTTNTKQVQLTVLNGNVISNKTYKSSYTRSYFDYLPNLEAFVYINLNWKDLPKLANETVTAWFSANKNGVVDSVVVSEGANDILAKELTRVLKKLPHWNSYFEDGVFFRTRGEVTVIFSEENRKRFQQ